MTNDERTIGEAFRLIADARDLCAQRSERHVDQSLYTSERDTLRRELAALSETQAVLKQRHEDDVRAITVQHDNYVAEQRQWRNKVWLAVVTAFVGPTLTGMFLYFLLEVGAG